MLFKEMVMAFVFSFWYFVMIALVAGIVACLVIFFKMDKKDKELIAQLVKDSEAETQQKEESAQKIENSNNG